MLLQNEFHRWVWGGGGLGASVLLSTHPFELFLQLFPQGLGTVMKLVLQLSVALLEALQGPTLGLNISPLLERHNTHPHTEWMGEGRERQREKHTAQNPRHANQKSCKVLETDTSRQI